MKTKIKYESFKRAKDILGAKKAYEKYAEYIDEPIELKLYDCLDRMFHQEKYPVPCYCETDSKLFDELYGVYNLAAKYKLYIYEDMETAFQYFHTGAKYYAMSHLTAVGKKYSLDIERHEKAIYQLISVNEWELASGISVQCPVIQAMLNGEYKRAKELLLADDEEADESQEPYFIHLPYVKQSYLAMLDGNEDEFNNQLAKRINKYRKRPMDYQPVIDVTSIALIKMAERLGLHYIFRVEEIPDYFFEEHTLPERIDCNIIDFERCKKAFEEWGDYAPSIEEIQDKLFR